MRTTQTAVVAKTLVSGDDQRFVINKLTSPEEAIERLKTSPEGTFFYMMRADKLDKNDAFSYLVCPHFMIDVKNYSTISLKGVAHISDAN